VRLHQQEATGEANVKDESSKTLYNDKKSEKFEHANEGERRKPEARTQKRYNNINIQD